VLFPKVIFQVIDQLNSPLSDLREGAFRWLQISLEFIPSIFDMLFDLIAEALPCIDDDQSMTPEFSKSFNIAQLNFVVDSIITVLDVGDLALYELLEERNVLALQESVIVEAIPTKFRFDNPFGNSNLGFFFKLYF
jgi:hypothetical protein